MARNAVRKLRLLLSNKYILFALLLIAAFTIRMRGVIGSSLRNDELWTIWFSSDRYIKSFIEMLYISSVKFFDIPPLYHIIMRFWIRIFGDSEISMRLPSVLFGSFSIPLFYWITRAIVSKRASIISTLLLLFLPIHIHYSQEARNYSLFFLLSLISMYFYIRGVKAKNKKWATGYVASSALMLYTHYFAIFLITGQILYAAYVLKKGKLWKGILFPLSLSIVPLMLPFLLRYFSTVEVVGSWIKRISIWEGFKSELFFLSPYTKFFPINYVFIALFVVGFIRVIRTSPGKKAYFHYFLIPWFLLPILVPLVFTQLAFPIFVERYAILSLAPFILYVAIGIESIIKNNIILIFLFLTFISLPFRQDPSRTPRENFEDWRSTIPRVIEKKFPILPIPDTPATRMGIEYYSYTTPHLTTQEQLNDSCKSIFLVVSRTADFKLKLKCSYTRRSLHTINPPFVFQYSLVSDGD